MFREVLLTDPRSKVRRQTSFFSTASMSPPAVGATGASSWALQAG